MKKYSILVFITSKIISENNSKKLKSTTGWDNVDHVCNHCAHWTENQKDYNVCPVCNNSRIHGQHSGNGDNSSGFNAFSIPVDMESLFGYKTVFFGKITGIHADLMGLYNHSDFVSLLKGEQQQGYTGSSNLPSYMIFRLIKE